MSAGSHNAELDGFNGTITDSILHEALRKLEARERVLAANKAELVKVKKAIADIEKSLGISKVRITAPNGRSADVPRVSAGQLLGEVQAVLREHGVLSKAEIRERVGHDSGRIGALVPEWVEEGALVRVGRGRDTMYDLPERVRLAAV